MLEFLIPNNVMCHAVEAMLFASLGCAILSVLITQMNISSIGFTMSHAAFAGGSVGAFFGYAVLPSAVLVSILTAFLMGPLSDRTRMHTDTTLGVLFGTMMAVAIFFIALMQGTGKGFDASSLLYGNVISLYREEIYALAVITCIILIFLIIFYKEITAIVFHKRLADCGDSGETGLLWDPVSDLSHGCPEYPNRRRTAPVCLAGDPSCDRLPVL